PSPQHRTRRHPPGSIELTIRIHITDMVIEIATLRLGGHQLRVDAQGHVVVLVDAAALDELDFEDAAAQGEADRPDQARLPGAPVHVRISWDRTGPQLSRNLP